MARILLGWELGAGTGHIVRLAPIADMLAAQGHEVGFAVQHIALAPPGYTVWQAPLWPTQLSSMARRTSILPATMGDILAVLGLDDVAAVSAMIAAWDAILLAAKPDLILADYAPGLTLAARKRVPLLAASAAFSAPPAHLDRFPSFLGAPAEYDEARLLDGVNQALRRNGREELRNLPAILGGDRVLPSTFAELDPYRADRRDALVAPSVAPGIRQADGSGDEIFVYLNGSRAWPNAFWQGLVDSRLPVRVYDARMNAADGETLERAGLTIERAVVPFARIVERSRLVMSHCGFGLACSALAAGLPHLMMPFDIEKRLTAKAVVALGLGVQGEFGGLEAGPFATLLRETYADEALGERARAAAPGFRARLTPDAEAATIKALGEMLGG